MARYTTYDFIDSKQAEHVFFVDNSKVNQGECSKCKSIVSVDKMYGCKRHKFLFEDHPEFMKCKDGYEER